MGGMKTSARTATCTVQEAANALAGKLRQAGFATPELDARLIVCDACGLSREAYFLNSDRRLSCDEAAAIEYSSACRLSHKPVSRIIGKREFWGREFKIGPSVLDPRPDTETLVEAALEILKEEKRHRSSLKILDLGTGSGCILLSLLSELPDAWGVGVDIDHSALQTARENADRLDLSARSAFICGNWCAPFFGPFDLIISNPPYIRGSELTGLSAEVLRHDPVIALDGGVDGLQAYRHIAAGAKRIAQNGTWIVLEAGIGQANEIVQLFKDAGWTGPNQCARLYQDLASINRVVAIKRQTMAR